MASAASALLDAVTAYLAVPGALDPAPATVGVVEPADAAELPAVVLALERLDRGGGGLGERAALITDGALAWTARIELADPQLPGEPGFSLLSPDRLSLSLPHGALVRADAGAGPLGPGDLTVSVAGVPRPVVETAPTGQAVRVEALEGRLVFATPLPASGELVASYYVGQWERRVVRITGVLRVEVRDMDAATVHGLSAALLEALESPGAVNGIRITAAVEVGSIGPPDPRRASSRGRVLRLAFEFEHRVDRPESSGGIIRRVPVTTHLEAAAIDPGTGAGIITVATEADRHDPAS